MPSYATSVLAEPVMIVFSIASRGARAHDDALASARIVLLAIRKRCFDLKST